MRSTSSVRGRAWWGIFMPIALPILALFIAAFALYANALDNPLLLDDHLVLETHPDVLKPEGLTRLWTHHYWEGVSRADRNLYRPVTILSFHVDALRGRSPATFRVPNVFLLGLLGALLLHWLRSWKVAPFLAWAAAVIVVVHPLQASVINYVVGRADLLAMVGVIGFLLVQKRSAEQGWTTAGGVLGMGFVLLAVGAKEGGLCVLPLALVQEWCMTGRGGRSLLLSRSALIAGAPAALYLAMRVAVVGTGHAYGMGYAENPMKNPLVGMSFIERAPASLSIAWFYAKQLVSPDPSFWHVPDRLPVLGDPEVWLGAALFLALLASLVVTLRRRSPVAIPIALALLQFALVGQVVRALAFYAANRQGGPFLIALSGCLALVARRWTAERRARDMGLAALFVATSVPLALQVRTLNSMWTSPERMAEIDLQRHPDELDSLAANASASLQAGHHREALHFGAQVVKRRPEFAGAWLELGLAHLGLRQTGRAREAFLEVLRITNADRVGRGYRARALNNLAGLAQQRGDAQEAERYLLEAVSIQPRDLRLLQNLAALAEQRGDVLEVARRCVEILEHHPAERSPMQAAIAGLIPELERIASRKGDTVAVECADLIETLRGP